MVFAAEALKYMVFVLPNSFDQVTGDTHIQSAIWLVGQDINEWGFHASTTGEVNGWSV